MADRRTQKQRLRDAAVYGLCPRCGEPQQAWVHPVERGLAAQIVCATCQPCEHDYGDCCPECCEECSYDA